MRHVKNYSRIKAFSLIEIMIVLGILSVLTAYAIPQYMSWSLDAKKARAKQDLATLAEQVSKYEADQNSMVSKGTVESGGNVKIDYEDIQNSPDRKVDSGGPKIKYSKDSVIRLKSLSELRGKYMANLEKLRDPWGFEYLVLPEKGEIITLELLGYKTQDGTMIKINAAAGEKLPANLPPGATILYKKFVEDSHKKPTGEHPKMVYSRGPNGLDEKGKGDDLKHECRRFKYLHSVIENTQ